MRAVLQRVQQASVIIHKNTHASIESGLLILLAVHINDTMEDIQWLAQKIIQMRIFNDSENKMNLSIHDVQGSILVISQFTLFASSKKGNRPSYIQSAPPIQSIPLYEEFIRYLQSIFYGTVKSGIFGADMQVQLTNDGPVTIIIDSKLKE